MKLSELVPDAAELIRLETADLAGYVLEMLIASHQPGTGQWHRATFVRDASASVCGSNNSPLYSSVQERCAEAWDWLAVNLLIGRVPEDNNDWHRPTRKGLSVRDRSGLRRLIEQAELPEHFLHPKLLLHVRPLYMQGRFDIAVLEAYKTLEVEMRTAAKLDNSYIGTKVASRAFDPQGGILTDMSAEAGERQALMNMMCGALGGYKNPQSHRKVDLDAPTARELIVMASHLLKIVDQRRPPE